MARKQNKVEGKQVPSGTVINNCEFNAVKLDADATRVAQSIAEAARAIAESNKRNADALHELACRFARTDIDCLVKIGQDESPYEIRDNHFDGR